VLLYDVVSTDNCMLRGQDPRLINIIGTGIQLSFMVALLLVQLCTNCPNVNNVRGNVYLESLFLRKEKSRLCRTSLSDRVLHSPPTNNRYVLTTVISFISTNVDNFIHPISKYNLRNLQYCQQCSHLSHPSAHNLLLYLRSTYIPPLHETNIQFNRLIAKDFLAYSPFITTNITTDMDGYMVHPIPMPSQDEDASLSTYSPLGRTQYTIRISWL
jgi:hypothetical protein